jgi:hypothetical protein
MSPRHGYRRTVFALAVLLLAAVALAVPYKALLSQGSRPDMSLAASLHTSETAVPVVHSLPQSDPQGAKVAQVKARNSYDASVAKVKARKLARKKARAKAAAEPAVTDTPAPVQSPAPSVPAPSSDPQQIALGMLPGYGWSVAQFGCLLPLWDRESGWNVYASNPGSGAYGIPQALPGDKMASAGADWQTDAATQIRWGLGYIKGSYGSPCGAWSHEEAYGWY